MRLIGSDGTQLGILSVGEALKKAMEQNLDLVEVAPNAKPPVCKIMDYGKYKFQQAKKHSKPKTISVKEVKLRPQIGIHDLEMKINNMKRFLENGDRVKITMVFRGREILHPDFANKVFDKIKEALEEKATVDSNPKWEGRRMIMTLLPKGG